VTRAGGVGHNKRQKSLAAETLKMLASYRQAEEFSHFGSELGPEAKQALATGKRVFELLTQAPGDTFSLMAQQLMLDVVLHLEDGAVLDINSLKLNANDFANKVTKDEEYASVLELLLKECVKNAPKTSTQTFNHAGGFVKETGTGCHQGFEGTPEVTLLSGRRTVNSRF
jgi:F0F1-type ATP synthase alpha subunit